MIKIARKIIRWKLKIFAKIYLQRVKPRVIVIAGTTNRFWIKESVLLSLRDKKLAARGNKKNFNAEIGLPLSILGLQPDEEGESKITRWFNVLLKSFAIAFYRDKKTKYLILEMAIDRPHDMAYLLSIVKPQIAIFTSITMIYPENFSSLDLIAKEYQKLISVLPRIGKAFLNADDERIILLKEKAKCEVITYGIKNQKADYIAKDIIKVVDGQEFKAQTSELDVKTIKIKRFGTHHIYANLVGEIMNDLLINK